MYNQFKTQKFKHLMLAMGPRDLNSAPYSPVHCSSHSMTSFQSSELTELPVVENSQLFAQRAHSARYAPSLLYQQQTKTTLVLHVCCGPQYNNITPDASNLGAGQLGCKALHTGHSVAVGARQQLHGSIRMGSLASCFHTADHLGCPIGAHEWCTAHVLG